MFKTATNALSSTRYIKYGLLALFFVATQVIATVLATGLISAAPLNANDVRIASEGFKLSGSYTTPSNQPTGAGAFNNGSIADYPEGACIPVLFEVKNNSNSAGDTVVSPVFDYLNGVIGVQNLETITTGLSNPGSADNLNDFSYPGTSLSSTTSFKVSGGGTVSAAITGPFVGNNTGTGAVSGSDAQRHYNIALTNIPANKTVYVIFCAKLGLDSSQYNGASMSIRAAQDGQENIPITTNKIKALPSLTLSKTVVQGSAFPSNFSFTTSPAINGQSVFAIADGQTSVTIPNAQPGQYTVTESGPTGYTFTSGAGTNCSANTPTIGTAGGAMTATLSYGSSTTCNFSNTVLKGSIKITKDAVPNDSQDFEFSATGNGTSNFILDDDGSNSNTRQNSKTFSNLLPGTYVFSENSVSGWSLYEITCNGQGVQTNGATLSVTLSPGQNLECTFVNKKRGKITVQKVTAPANSPTNFSITATGSGTITGSASRSISTSSSTTYDVDQGSYAISEDLSNTPGWQMTNNTCQDIVINSSNLNQTCTITNTKVGSITINKNAIPNHEQNFGFSVTGQNLTPFILDDDNDATYSNQQVFSSLLPGTYVIGEAATTGWKLTALTCTGGSYSQNGTSATITLTAGQNVACTFENTKLATISGYKHDVDANGTSNGTLSGWTINLFLNNQLVGTTGTDNDGYYSFADLLPGTSYSLTEQLINGWTQIYSPTGVSLSAGDNIQNKDFGNFKNVKISGFKYNDKNGNGDYDNEPKLKGWTIQLLMDGDDTDAYLDDVVATDVTDLNGNYEFTNVKPGIYLVCEQQQDNWHQTAPTTNDGCYMINVTESGYNFTNKNFGNQGHGTVKVKKHLDTDGDGDVDEWNVDSWQWYVDNNEDRYATGTTQQVNAGDHEISEVVMPNYHVSKSICSLEDHHDEEDEEDGDETHEEDEEDENENDNKHSKTWKTNNTSYDDDEDEDDEDDSPAPQATTTIDVEVNPGDEITCEFVNTRDTGKLTIKKDLYPSTDNGKFNLRADNTTYASNVGDEGTTGELTLPTGNYMVSETAGTYTNLSDYASSYTCQDGDYILAQGQGTAIESIAVTVSSDVTCTFTNKKLGKLTIVKDARPDSDQEFDFHISTYSPFDLMKQEKTNPLQLTEVEDESTNDYFTLVDDGTNEQNSKSFDNLELYETYYVTENEQEGWDLRNIYCSGDVSYETWMNVLAITLYAGDDITCTFVNDKRGTITIIKDAQPDTTQPFEFTTTIPTYEEEDEEDDEEDFQLQQYPNTNFQLVDSGDESGSNTKTFTNVRPGWYTVDELENDNWTLDDIVCDYGDMYEEEDVPSRIQSRELEQDWEWNYDLGIYLYPGQNVVCTFINTQDATPTLHIEKSNNATGPTTVGNEVTYTVKITAPAEGAPVFNAVVTDLPPANFTYIGGSWTASSSNALHNVASDVATGSIIGEPTYGSPGDWHIGNLLPGEVVTLTYRTLIQSIVTPGTYPDAAFVRGMSWSGSANRDVIGGCLEGCLAALNSAFVTSSVEIVQSDVAGPVFKTPQSVLVNTGQATGMLQILAPLMLLTATALSYRLRVRSSQKGAK